MMGSLKAVNFCLIIFLSSNQEMTASVNICIPFSVQSQQPKQSQVEFLASEQENIPLHYF